MRKRLIFSVLLTLIMVSCGKRPNTVIKGTIQNGARNYLYLDYLNIDKTEKLDSLKIKKDDTFKFRLHLDEPGVYLIRNEKGKLINLLPSPEEKISLEADYNDMNRGYLVSGSKESENIRQLVEKIYNTRDRLTELDNTYGSLSNVTEEEASEYINQRKVIIKEQRDFSIQFIIGHLSSLASVYAVYQMISPGQYVLGENRDIQYMKIIADSLSGRYPDVPFVESFIDDARKSEQKFYTAIELQKKLKDAAYGLPDLRIPDINGDTIALSSLKGKTVLLYFWASSSATSRQQNLALENIYKKNKANGFEIYAVSLDKNRSSWRDAIRYDEVPWINVSELSFPDSRATMIYNVKKLPASFLLNSKGEVVARDIYGKELQKWLDNMLK